MYLEIFFCFSAHLLVRYKHIEIEIIENYTEFLIETEILLIFVIKILKSCFITQKKLKSETAELKTAVKELEVQNSQQNEELVHLKSKISNLESFLISTPKLPLSDATNLSSNNTNFSPSLTELGGPPSSCQKLKEGNGLVPMNGIHLLKINNKIQAAFYKFPLDGSPGKFYS